MYSRKVPLFMKIGYKGRKYTVKEAVEEDFAGTYSLQVGNTNYDFTIQGKPGQHKGEIKHNDTTTLKTKLKIEEGLITISFDPKDDERPGRIRLSGWREGRNWKGRGQLSDGDWVTWQATYGATVEDIEKQRKEQTPPVLGEVLFPFTAFGTTELPTQETLLIKNATVWTNEKEGILENTDVLIKDGKIARIGQNLSDRNARVIDGTGKHLTPGIIDEHSHTALDGVNDVATNSGMVRMRDVLDPESPSLYYQLAGGVTAAQLLHGSANPVGGQSALIKFRWGVGPEDLLIDDADGFIKFALGENVKRSRSNQSIRYPQTRMGVEQVYVDAFTNARTYEQEWQAYNSLSTREKAATPAPRRDLVHDTMLEILNGKRFISCHSYVQSEINMADESS